MKVNSEKWLEKQRNNGSHIWQWMLGCLLTIKEETWGNRYAGLQKDAENPVKWTCDEQATVNDNGNQKDNSSGSETNILNF